MKVTQERLEGSRIALTVEVEPEQVSRATDRAYQHLGGQYVVPGFRKGKAPRHILRNFVGDQRVRQETLDHLLPDAYRDALKDSGVEPIADPEVELLTMEPEQPLSFKATVPVAPTVELGDYHTLHVEAQPVDVTEERIDAVIEDLRKQYATWEDVTERGIESGDRITADVNCLAEGETLIDAKDQELTVGSNGLPKEVDEGLIGTQAGEERTVLANLPDDYPRPELAGKEAVYTIAVKSIKQPILPPIDDDLAQKTPGIADVAALRADIRQRMETSARDAETERQRTSVVNDLIAASKLDYPAFIVERQLDRSLETFAGNVARQGFDPEQYFRMLGVSPDDLRVRWRADAEETVKRDLVLAEVATAEGIEPTQEQVMEELHRLAGNVPAEQLPEVVAANPRLLTVIRSSARERMALDRLVELALASPPPEASAESVPDEAGEEAAAEISPALAAEADEQATAEGQ
ncbi:MAG TPA: trigger factor [Chloroflexota bacterium]